VGFISPASPPEQFPANVTVFQENIIAAMGTLGLKVKFGQYAWLVNGYLAGTDEQRASDVNTMFGDKTVSAIIANRGGYGCDRILKYVDWDLVAANPKPLMGYSDLTALLLATYTKTGMITFHGPMGCDPWPNTYNPKYFQDIVMSAQTPTMSVQDGFNITTITGGRAKGKLLGGNASLLASIVGTEYFPSLAEWKGAILFMEEVEEPSYHVDRFLSQLMNADVLSQISGFVWGKWAHKFMCLCVCVCANCTESGFTIVQVLQQYIAPLNIPAFSGAMFGHDMPQGQITLPQGILAEIDATAGTIELLEVAASPQEKRLDREGIVSKL